MRLRAVLLGILLVVASAGCGNAPGPGAAASGDAVTADTLVGRWVPAGGAGSGAPTRPFVDLAADGTYTGSDGCNAASGTWTVTAAGALAVSSGPSTLIGCEDMVSVPTWFATASRVRFDGDVLVLGDADGTETGRVERAS